MDVSQTVAIRNKIVGLLVRRARLRAGKSQRECAGLIGCSPAVFGQYEKGQRGLTLPQLEALAYFFGVPLVSLWDEKADQPEESAAEPVPLAEMMALRRKMLAVQFRQCRRAAGLTQQQMGQLLGCSATRISQYERGRSDIPLAELEIAAGHCHRTLADFVDEQTIPLSRAEQERQTLARLRELPPDVREFVLKPSNVLYLRVAMLLSAIKTDSLRQIAETILDITY